MRYSGRDEVTNERELAAAEQHVRDGEEQIAKLKARIIDQRVVNGDSSQTEELLIALKAAQKQAIEDRNTLFRQVAGNDY